MKYQRRFFADENGLYVEILDDNYHNADIIGFSIAMKKDIFIFQRKCCIQSDAFKKWAEDETKKKISL